MADINKKQGSQLNNLVKKFKIDWLGWVVFVASAVLAGVFLLNKMDGALLEVDARESQNQNISDQIFYLYNVQFGDSTPQKTYEEARQALLNGDLEGVLGTIHPDYLWKYEDNLTAFHNDKDMYVLAERMTPLRAILYEYENVIEYSIEPIPGNNSDNPLERYAESIEFTRDNKGVWKISS